MATGCDTTLSLIADGDAVVWLGDTGSTANWGRIFDLVNAVAARMNSEAGRQLKASTWTEYYDGDGGDSLLLDHFPLSSTTIVVTVDASRGYTTTYVIPSTDVLLDTEMGRVRLQGYSFSAGDKSIKVAYSAGYSSAGPAWDLIGAAKTFLQVAWNQASKRDTVGVRSESFEGGSRTFENDLPWSVKQVLELYKDRRAG